MRLIVVTGMPGSGKEEFLTVASSMSIPFVRMGDVVREAYAVRGDEDRDLSVGQFAARERERFGANIWARRVLNIVDDRLWLIDGCRSMDEVKAFRELADDVEIVAIHAPPSQRYARLVARHRDDAPKDIREFEERDLREMGWGIAGVISLSEHMLVNDGSLPDFKMNAGDLLESLR